MATRSITTICDAKGPMAQFYKHLDGGPADWGVKLHEFLEGFTVKAQGAG